MVDAVVYYLIHFCFVFAAMVLFFAPFVTVFYIRNRQQIRDKRPHFNFFMEMFFTSREANYLVLVWAACEAVFWFIIPEFLLFLMIFMRVKRKVNLLKYDILGTFVGTVAGFWLHVSPHMLLQVPYVFQGMIDQTRFWYDKYNVWGLVFQPFSGVPYKVFTSLAIDYHFFFVWFLLIAVVARISRYVIAYEVTKALYPLLHRFVRKHYAVLFVVAIMIFTGLLLRVATVYGVGYKVH